MCEPPDLEQGRAYYEGKEVTVVVDGEEYDVTIDTVRLGDGGGFLLELSFVVDDTLPEQ